MIPSAFKQKVFSWFARNYVPCEVQDALVVAGTGRSGTTWLAELLRSLPGYKFLHEPLNPGRNPEVKRFGLQHSSYDRVCLSPDQEAPEFRNFMRRLLEGRTGPSGLWRADSDSRWIVLREFLVRRKVLVKFTRALRLLHWLEARFNPLRTIVIVRHPCAVVHSMMNYGAWDPERLRDQSPIDFDFSESLLASLPPDLREKFRPRLEGVVRPHEMMAHLWAIDYSVAFFEQGEGDYPWLLVPYERLVRDSQNEVGRITRSLGRPEERDRLTARLDTPSRYASDDLATSKVQRQLTKWKRSMNPDHAERVLEIVHRYGLDFYDASPEPDYVELEGYQGAEFA